MSTIASSFAGIANADLLIEIKRLAAIERHATAQLIAALSEMDARRLYLAEGCSSLFVYCTRVLYLSEHAAYGRIEGARAARRFPEILQLLEEGALTLTAVSLLSPHLTADNCNHIFQAARHKSKREIEELVAALRPRADAASMVRKLPEPRLPSNARPMALEEPTAPPPSSASALTGAVRTSDPTRATRACVAPLSPERFKVQFTVSRETRDKLRRAQDLLRHQIPNGDPARVFDRALTVLLEKLEGRKLAGTARPRSTADAMSLTRYVPAAVRRAVWKRDGGRCGFIGSQGRCAETGFLEFHHVVPYSQGGKTSADNLQLRCRAHNAFEAEVLGLRPPLAPTQRDG